MNYKFFYKNEKFTNSMLGAAHAAPFAYSLFNYPKATYTLFITFGAVSVCVLFLLNLASLKSRTNILANFLDLCTFSLKYVSIFSISWYFATSQYVSILNYYKSIHGLSPVVEFALNYLDFDCKRNLHIFFASLLAFLGVFLLGKKTSSGQEHDVFNKKNPISRFYRHVGYSFGIVLQFNLMLLVFMNAYLFCLAISNNPPSFYYYPAALFMFFIIFYQKLRGAINFLVTKRVPLVFVFILYFIALITFCFMIYKFFFCFAISYDNSFHTRGFYKVAQMLEIQLYHPKLIHSIFIATNIFSVLFLLQKTFAKDFAKNSLMFFLAICLSSTCVVFFTHISQSVFAPKLYPLHIVFGILLAMYLLYKVVDLPTLRFGKSFNQAYANKTLGLYEYTIYNVLLFTPLLVMYLTTGAAIIYMYLYAFLLGFYLIRAPIATLLLIKRELFEKHRKLAI